MSYNPDAQVFETQIVVTNTTQPAGVTSGSIINKGSLSTYDTYVTGHTVINNVKITPNRNDIIYERQATLTNNQNSYADITDFTFADSVCNSFKAIINVTVSTGESKTAVWELIGLYKPTGWVITSSFTGDLTGVQFSIANKSGGIAQVQYVNSNTSGTTVIRYRATTTAPVGTTPLDVTTGVVNNTSGPFVENSLIYANSTNSLAGADILYSSNVLRVGGFSRMVAENASSFVNFSNGGAISSMGDASVAKKMIVGDKVGISNTAPTFSLDVGGDINFTGSFYKNGSLYTGSEIWAARGNEIYFTSGNVGLGMTDPSHSLDVAGGIMSTSITSGHIIPSGDLQYDLGSETRRWRDLYLSTSTIKFADGTQLSTSEGNLKITDNSTGKFVSLGGEAISSANLSSSSGEIASFVAVNITSSNLLASGLISTGTAVATTFTGGSIGLTGAVNAGSAVVSGNATFGSNVVVAGPVLQIPSGNTAARPANAVGGVIRYNTQTQQFEGYGPGESWGSLGGVVDIAQTTKVLASGSPSTTDGNLYFYTVNSERMRINSAGNIGIGTSSPSALLDVAGRINAQSVSAGSFSVGGITSGHIVPSGDLVYDLGSETRRWRDIYLSTSTIKFADGTQLSTTAGNLKITDNNTGKFVSLGGEAVSSANLASSTGQISSFVSVDITSSNLVATNISTTSISSATLSLSTGLTAGSARVSGAVNAGSVSSGSVNAVSGTVGQIVATNISSGTIVATTVSAGTSVATTFTGGSISLSGSVAAPSGTVANFAATTISAGTSVATTFTGGSMSLSGDLNIGGTLTTVNITTTNLSQTNVSAGTLAATNITSTNAVLTGISTVNIIATTASAGTAVATTFTGGSIGLTGSVLALGDVRGASLIVGGSGTYTRGSLYRDANWGMLLRSGTENPTLAQFSIADANDNKLFTISPGGNISIGTSSSSSILHVESATPEITLRSTATKSASGVIGKITFSDSGNGGAAIESQNDLGGTNNNGNLIFRTSEDFVNFQRERLRINRSGNVGINTSTPTYRLHVVDSNTDATAMLENTAATGYAVMKYKTTTQEYNHGVGGVLSDVSNKIYWFFNSAVRLVMDTSGRLGIGTMDPSDQLHLFTSSTNTNIGTITQNGSRQWRAGIRGDTSNSYVIQDDTAAAMRLVINTSGNVGIGTGTPACKFDMNQGTLRVTGTSQEPPSSGVGIEMYYNGSQSLLVSYDRTNTVYRPLYIAGSVIALNGGQEGNVGIGTLTPSERLHVNGNINFTGSLYQNGSLFSGSSQWTSSVSNIFFNSGNVGIGTTSPQGPLHVSGTVGSAVSGNGIVLGVDGTTWSQIQLVSTMGSYIDFSSPGVDHLARIIYTNSNLSVNLITNSQTFLFASSGNFVCPGDISFFGNLSDARLKDQVSDISGPSALEMINTLRPVNFRWRDDIYHEAKRGEYDAGFIAQEVEQVLGLAVTDYTHEDQDYKALRHERFIPYLVAAIQQLSKKLSERASKREPCCNCCKSCHCE